MDDLDDGDVEEDGAHDSRPVEREAREACMQPGEHLDAGGVAEGVDVVVEEDERRRDDLEVLGTAPPPQAYLQKKANHAPSAHDLYDGRWRRQRQIGSITINIRRLRVDGISKSVIGHVHGRRGCRL